VRLSATTNEVECIPQKLDHPPWQSCRTFQFPMASCTQAVQEFVSSSGAAVEALQLQACALPSCAAARCQCLGTDCPCKGRQVCRSAAGCKLAMRMHPPCTSAQVSALSHCTPSCLWCSDNPACCLPYCAEPRIKLINGTNASERDEGLLAMRGIYRDGEEYLAPQVELGTEASNRAAAAACRQLGLPPGHAIDSSPFGSPPEIMGLHKIYMTDCPPGATELQQCLCNCMTSTWGSFGDPMYDEPRNTSCVEADIYHEDIGWSCSSIPPAGRGPFVQLAVRCRPMEGESE